MMLPDVSTLLRSIPVRTARKAATRLVVGSEDVEVSVDVAAAVVVVVDAEALQCLQMHNRFAADISSYLW
jgi:hypothetical protein